MTRSAPTAAVGHVLRANRLRLPALLRTALSAATPLTVIAGVVPTGFAQTGLLGIPIAFVAVALILALFTLGYLAMTRHVGNAGAFYSYIAIGLNAPIGVGFVGIARQRAGLGTALLQAHHARLDAATLGSYWEATSRDAAALYEAVGYRHDGGEIRLPDHGPPLWPMWRPPRLPTKPAFLVPATRPGEHRDKHRNPPGTAWRCSAPGSALHAPQGRGRAGSRRGIRTSLRLCRRQFAKIGRDRVPRSAACLQNQKLTILLESIAPAASRPAVPGRQVLNGPGGRGGDHE